MPSINIFFLAPVADMDKILMALFKINSFYRYSILDWIKFPHGNRGKVLILLIILPVICVKYNINYVHSTPL